MSCQRSWLSSTNKIKKSIKRVYEFDKIRHNNACAPLQWILYDFLHWCLCSYIYWIHTICFAKNHTKQIAKTIRYKCNNNILQNNKNKSLTLLHVKLFFYTCSDVGTILCLKSDIILLSLKDRRYYYDKLSKI